MDNKKKEYPNDHDLLVALDTKVSILIESLNRMNDSSKTRLADHESRIRKIEDDHLQVAPTKQVERIDALENKVGSFWRIVGIASGLGAVVGFMGAYFLGMV